MSNMSKITADYYGREVEIRPTFLPGTYAIFYTDDNSICWRLTDKINSYEEIYRQLYEWKCICEKTYGGI